MATLVVGRDVAAPAEQMWQVITDWPSHGRWVPLTTVTVTTRTDGPGTRFVGRTGVGRLGFDDPMEVVRWEPPGPDRTGTCTLRKTGTVVLGWAQITVEPQGRDRCRVTWTEDVDIAPVAWTAWASPLVVAGGRLAFGALLWQAAREAARG